MADIDTVITAVCGALSDCLDIDVMTAFPSGARARHNAPVAVVGLKAGSGVSGGFAEYLGISYDAEADEYSEVYGKRLELTLSADIYSPAGESYGAAACGGIFGDIVSALPSLPSGIRVREIKCGETKYDAEAGMFRLGAEMRLTALLCAETSDESEVLDFSLKGTVR